MVKIVRIKFLVRRAWSMFAGTAARGPGSSAQLFMMSTTVVGRVLKTVSAS